MSKVPVISQAAASLLRADHRNLLELESVVAKTGKCPPKILQDINVVCTPAIRLLFLSFEEGSYHHQTPGGLHLLRGMLQTLPDSKIVEDVHGTSEKRVRESAQQAADGASAPGTSVQLAGACYPGHPAQSLRDEGSFSAVLSQNEGDKACKA